MTHSDDDIYNDIELLFVVAAFVVNADNLILCEQQVTHNTLNDQIKTALIFADSSLSDDNTSPDSLARSKVVLNLTIESFRCQ